MSKKTARPCRLFRVLVEQPDAKTIANTKVPQLSSTTQVAEIADNRSSCLFFRMVVEQLDAKTIANTKVPPIGSTTQDAKIAPKSLLLEQVKKTNTNISTLQGTRGTSRCEDHCKYEGTAVWQYVSGCKDCGQLLLAEYVKANSTSMSLLQGGRGTAASENHCKVRHRLQRIRNWWRR